MEIYNEFVYDLLVPLSSKKARRATCKLGETKAGDVFIRGTREINVTSSTEALEVMAMGQRNRQMGKCPGLATRGGGAFGLLPKHCLPA